MCATVVKKDDERAFAACCDSAAALCKAQRAFLGAADVMEVSCEDDVQKLVDELRYALVANNKRYFSA